MTLSTLPVHPEGEGCSWQTMNWPGLHHLHWALEWFPHHLEAYQAYWSLIQHKTSWIQLENEEKIMSLRDMRQREHMDKIKCQKRNATSANSAEIKIKIIIRYHYTHVSLVQGYTNAYRKQAVGVFCISHRSVKGCNSPGNLSHSFSKKINSCL